MNVPPKLFAFLLFIFLCSSVLAQDCSILKNNTFTHRVAKQEVLIEFKEHTYIEYHQDKKYFIKSNIEWISPCEYHLIIKEQTLPNFPFKKGTKIAYSSYKSKRETRLLSIYHGR